MNHRNVNTVLLSVFTFSSALFASTGRAAIVQWNTQGVATNVAAGILSFDELLTGTSFTYVNVAVPALT